MMLVRLGNVLYWLGCILAALIIAAAIAEWFHDAQHHPWLVIIFEFAVFAFIGSAEISLADFRAIGELGRRPGSDHPTLR